MSVFLACKVGTDFHESRLSTLSIKLKIKFLIKTDFLPEIKSIMMMNPIYFMQKITSPFLPEPSI